jgi:DNA gyrase/topoisomerase IV subunit B
VATSPLRVAGATTATGTSISFTPDCSIFTHTTLDSVAVRARLYEIACFNPSLRVR